MIKSRYTMLVCSGIVILAIAATGFLMFSPWAQQAVTTTAKTSYESRLLNDQVVHSIDISVNESDWDTLLQQATSKEYISCNLTIDGEKFNNIAIRAKGNTSLSSVARMDTDRYSFKIEFDHYDNGTNYYGLDKLALNNIFQDNTYMKDYLSYQLMRQMGALAPLTSFADITVNGNAFGLYLAVEGIEEGFLKRNFGEVTGKIYKPDSMKMGGNPGGNQDGGMAQMRAGGMGFDKNGEPPAMPEQKVGQLRGERNQSGQIAPEKNDQTQAAGSPPEQIEQQTEEPSDQTTQPDREAGENTRQMPREGGFGGGPGGGGDDTALIYTDDSYDSYSNIFNSAILDISDADKDRLIQGLKIMNDGENLEDAVDVEEVIRYFVVHNFVNSFDSYTGNMKHNYYLYENEGKLAMIAWDYNLAFSGFGGGFGGGERNQTQGAGLDTATTQINLPIDSPLSGTTTDQRPMIAWILENPVYLEQYHQVFDEFIATYFESGSVSNEITRVFNMISPYVQKDVSAFCTFDEFQKGAATLKIYCELRADSIRKQLGGEIAITAEGQSEDKSNFVDASSISISNMGSMGGGGGMSRNPRETQTTTEESQNEEQTNPEIKRSEEAKPVFDSAQEGQPPQDGQRPTQGGNGNADASTENSIGQNTGMPQGHGGFGGPEADFRAQNSLNVQQKQSQQWLELAMAVGVLVVGIVFALIFQKRKKLK